jgi:hypothetical protein
MNAPSNSVQTRIFWALAGSFSSINRFGTEAVNDAGLFLLRRTERIPDLLSPVIRIATLAFGFGSLFLYGKPFYALNLSQRSAYVSLWVSSPLSPMRDYIRLVKSLLTLRAYES